MVLKTEAACGNGQRETVDAKGERLVGQVCCAAPPKQGIHYAQARIKLRDKPPEVETCYAGSL